MQRWLLWLQWWYVQYMPVEFRGFVCRMHLSDYVCMQPRLLGPKRFHLHYMSGEFRGVVQSMHRSESVCVQRWLCNNKRKRMRELRCWEIQAVRQQHILHELQRWHIRERAGV